MQAIPRLPRANIPGRNLLAGDVDCPKLGTISLPIFQREDQLLLNSVVESKMQNKEVPM